VTKFSLRALFPGEMEHLLLPRWGEEDLRDVPGRRVRPAAAASAVSQVDEMPITTTHRPQGSGRAAKPDTRGPSPAPCMRRVAAATLDHARAAGSVRLTDGKERQRR
jgi:hypothetical protein